MRRSGRSSFLFLSPLVICSYCNCLLSPDMKKRAPLVWSSLTEHVMKISLYSLFVIHATNSARTTSSSSSTSSISFSLVVNALICLLFLWMVVGEFNMMYQRLVRQLPPGHIGLPIIRDIQFLLTLTMRPGRELTHCKS